MAKIYELTTNGDDGYRKYFVRGIENDSQAEKLAKSVFQKYYWANGISYYADTETSTINSMTIESFRKIRGRYKR